MAGTGDDQEPGYTPEEIETLDKLRPVINSLAPEHRGQEGRALLRAMWPDPLQYIRKTHLIKTKKVGEVVLFKPNYAQIKLYEEGILKSERDCKPVRIVILKARQLGFSTFIASLYHEWCDRAAARSALTISYSKDSTSELFTKTLFVRRNQWFPRTKIRESRRTVMELDNDSTFFVKTAGTDSVGRGDTYHYLHCSEVPMWPDAEEAFTSVMQSIPDQQGTCVILESTARGATGPFYDEWCKAERGESDFIPFFAPWFWDPAYTRPFPSEAYKQKFEQSLNLEERRMLKRHNLKSEQLHWRRWCIANKCQGSTKKFQQEYPSTPQEAFLTTGSPVFDAMAIAELEHNSRPPLWRGEIGLQVSYKKPGKPIPDLQETAAGHLRVWDHPQDGTRYVVGADIAEGRVRDKTLSGRRKLYSYSENQPDYSAACVVELNTGLHVASWHGTINTHDFATVLAAIGNHYNTALIVPEINGPGIATVETLVAKIKYPKVYRARQYAVMENPGLATNYGWRTLPQTREHLMNRITEALAEGNLFTRDGRLIGELRSMERDPNGNPRAMGNNKDDRVFALALALQGRYDIGDQPTPGGEQPKDRKPDAWIWRKWWDKINKNENNRPVVPRHMPGGRPML